MAVATTVTKAILCYRDVEAQFGLQRSPEPNFFPDGVATNGYGFLFVKLVREPERRYGLSHNFTLLSDEQHDLRQVGRVLKRLVQLSE